MLLLHSGEYGGEWTYECNSPPIRNDHKVIARHSYRCSYAFTDFHGEYIRNMLLKFVRKAYSHCSHCSYQSQASARFAKAFARYASAFISEGFICNSPRMRCVVVSLVRRSQAFARYARAFVRNSQAFVTICKASFFQYFSRPFISFAANLPRISNFDIRKEIRHCVRVA
jgi:hypothetical protein